MNVGHMVLSKHVQNVVKLNHCNMKKIKNIISEYNKSKNFLDTLCKAYFDATASKSRKYIDWKLSDENPNCVGIGYDYYDWKGEYHCNTEWVSISELETFNKNK